MPLASAQRATIESRRLEGYGLRVEETWTIRRVVTWMAKDFAERGLDSPRLDADLLVADALSVDRVSLYMDLDRPLHKQELLEIRARVARRRAREPLAYIVGKREFYGRPFDVTADVLVPRPDTETLVEAALGRLDNDSAGPVLDLCTGSGIVGITLALERPMLQVQCTDVSPATLVIAKRNAEVLKAIDRTTFTQSDLFEAVASTFFMIVANPPYIAATDRQSLSPEIRDHEPALALFAGDDGLSVIRRIVADAKEYLLPRGHLLFEIGAGQGTAVHTLLQAEGFEHVEVLPDLAGIPRVAVGQVP